MKSNQELTESWRHRVQAFESSGLTRNGYRQRNGIKVHQLDYWRRKFRKLNSTDRGPAGGWIPLKIREDQAIERGSGVCLRIGRLEIEVKPGFDRQILTDVLGIVDPIC
jgi:hypothetical protein